MSDMCFRVLLHFVVAGAAVASSPVLLRREFAAKPTVKQSPPLDPQGPPEKSVPVQGASQSRFEDDDRTPSGFEDPPAKEDKNTSQSRFDDEDTPQFGFEARPATSVGDTSQKQSSAQASSTSAPDDTRISNIGPLAVPKPGTNSQNGRAVQPSGPAAEADDIDGTDPDFEQHTNPADKGVAASGSTRDDSIVAASALNVDGVARSKKATDPAAKCLESFCRVTTTPWATKCGFLESCSACHECGTAAVPTPPPTDGSTPPPTKAGPSLIEVHSHIPEGEAGEGEDGEESLDEETDAENARRMDETADLEESEDATAHEEEGNISPADEDETDHDQADVDGTEISSLIEQESYYGPSFSEAEQVKPGYAYYSPNHTTLLEQDSIDYIWNLHAPTDHNDPHGDSSHAAQLEALWQHYAEVNQTKDRNAKKLGAAHFTKADGDDDKDEEDDGPEKADEDEDSNKDGDIDTDEEDDRGDKLNHKEHDIFDSKNVKVTRPGQVLPSSSPNTTTLTSAR